MSFFALVRPWWYGKNLAEVNAGPSTHNDVWFERDRRRLAFAWLLLEIETTTARCTQCRTHP